MMAIVAGEEDPLPAVVHHDADAVRIRIRAEQDVGAGLWANGREVLKDSTTSGLGC
jgi:hypothetical protein